MRIAFTLLSAFGPEALTGKDHICLLQIILSAVVYTNSGDPSLRPRHCGISCISAGRCNRLCPSSRGFLVRNRMLRHCRTKGIPEIDDCCKSCITLMRACTSAGEGINCTELHFQTRESGVLTVKRSADQLYHLSVPYLHPEPPSSAMQHLCTVSLEVLHLTY